MLLKLNNNILILETDAKLKEWRIGMNALKQINQIQEKEIRIYQEEVEALRQGKPYDRKGHREAHTKPGQKSIEIEIEEEEPLRSTDIELTRLNSWLAEK